MLQIWSWFEVFKQCAALIFKCMNLYGCLGSWNQLKKKKNRTHINSGSGTLHQTFFLKERKLRFVSVEKAEFVPPLLLFIALHSGRGLCGSTQVPAHKERVTRAGRSHQMQHGEISFGLHDVWMLLWTGWPGLAQRQGRLVRQQFQSHSSPNLTEENTARLITVCGKMQTLYIYMAHLYIIWWQRYNSASAGGVPALHSGDGVFTWFPPPGCLRSPLPTLHPDVCAQFQSVNSSTGPQNAARWDGREGMMAKFSRLTRSNGCFEK